MAGSQADPIVARAFGGVVVASTTASGAVSYDDTGTRFVFQPAAGDRARYALDLETKSAQISPEIQSALGTSSRLEALRIWTELELYAKLTNLPVLACLKSDVPCALPPQTITLQRADTTSHFIAVGRCQPLTTNEGGCA